ncbi:elongation factor P maturation arginine rhamnosyltransferase EarP [Pseudothauera rhizosphaerae]|uniref:Protein-arginine rhamnosyltransferase n=2 Tax=Pseudothauera rhizosphaerae TaxID=2565932 RepID=A0A4S4AR40_9RHOO|nr:elongation factor P maturation arginine rhamnosyltransferase EarP [Pseudothauera rhizosphaerae]THF62250.1 elongation factor P maturation arginine rhamnosyltransferase EarP [Pseudothauera rhizosphaerae]
MLATDRPAVPDCEIFCRVVDNLGDIGVCWRLARDLATRGLGVRLWVDGWATLVGLCPPAADGACVAGVELRRWTEPFPDAVPARLVIEAFACDVPPRHLEAMAAREPKPAWLNLEYLSAEDWVAGCHGMASPHPRLPLTKRFFFPGFVPGTGGLVQESGLVDARRAFQADPAARAALFAALGVAPAPDALVVSLFAYGHGQLAGLLDAWAAGPRPVCLLVPEGRMADALATACGRSALAPGEGLQRGALDIRVLPFTDQDGYDRLLWACDLNFVRGEDSFVRAQWAARALVWQIYRQQEDAHHVKLDAFMARYTAGLDADVAAALRRFWRAWNEVAETEGGAPETPAACWPAFAAALPRLAAHAREWSAELEALPDLAQALAKFLEPAVKC